MTNGKLSITDEKNCVQLINSISDAFVKAYITETLDEEINAWIENYDKELIDVKLTVDLEQMYTATVIYIDKRK
ncbi:hypothetical protein BIZ98_gp41 [Streptococcus phage 9874]|uniref:Uncharacterized protein n=1 Tax=Streptococcus phage 9874 TaxID=1814960 RepID=A0A191KBS3_9CAUD|nr:hypothetical protein BIZ98_gp41 [Streptococcus phage 9874]AMQ65882.1 hypothetical protein P9874_41 [Streptococcus phage 9874]